MNVKAKACCCLASVAIAMSAFAGNEANPDALELAPLPLPVEFKSDMDNPVPFDSSTTVAVECPDKEAADWLSRHFAEWYGKDAPKVVSGKVPQSLSSKLEALSSNPPALSSNPQALSSKLQALSSESYAITADASGVNIAARSLAGVRWAAYSLRQLAIEKRGTFTTEGHILPTMSISDKPHLGFRAVHLCWLPELRPQQIERAIRLAALLKFNYAIIEPWGMYASEKHPWWHWPNPTMTKERIRSLVALGRDLGITLIPQINAYGHASASRACTLKHVALDFSPKHAPLFEPGGWNWCLSNPETQRVLREIIAEIHEDFGNPPYFHLGCDEAQPPACPECRKAPYGELVCKHISSLAEFVKSRGARAMIWHDMLLERGDPRWEGFVHCGSKDTAKLADTLPKDVIICDWQYSYKNMKEARMDWPTMAYFKEKGFSVAGCPWRNYNAMKPMADFIAKIGGFGLVGTTWHHLRDSDWASMYRFASSAAWGTPVRGSRACPVTDIEFANVLRMAGHDMKVDDYLDAGNVNYQLPPSWWIDN